MKMIDDITLSDESKEFMNKYLDKNYLSFTYYQKWFLDNGIDICAITLGGYLLSRYIGILEFGDVLKKIEHFYSDELDKKK